MDFEKLHPTAKEKRAIFRSARKKRVRYLPHDPTQRALVAWGFLRPPADLPRGVFDASAPEYLEPTDECRRFSDWVKCQRREHRMEPRRYWITTCIAITALIIAIVSLLQSVGLIDLSHYLRP